MWHTFCNLPGDRRLRSSQFAGKKGEEAMTKMDCTVILVMEGAGFWRAWLKLVSRTWCCLPCRSPRDTLCYLLTGDMRSFQFACDERERAMTTVGWTVISEVEGAGSWHAWLELVSLTRCILPKEAMEVFHVITADRRLRPEFSVRLR